MRRPAVALVAAILAVLLPSGAARAEPRPVSGYLTLSDGTEMSFGGLLPDGTGPFPVVLQYDGYAPGSDLVSEWYPFVEHGYAGIGVNFPGSGCSGGPFHVIDAGTWARQGAEAVELIAEQPWSDGNIGMVGGSFPGLSQLGVAAFRPPHLNAIMPEIVTTDFYRDVVYPGGIYNAHFMAFWGVGAQPGLSALATGLGVVSGDTRCAGNVAGAAVPTATGNILLEAARHPFIDDYWSRTLDAYIDTIEVPVLACQHWQDEEVGGRSAQIYLDRLRPETTWFLGENGGHSFCGAGWRERQLRFLERFVNGVPNGFEETPHATITHEAGSEGAWLGTLPSWPFTPTPVGLHLREGGVLSLEVPTTDEGPDGYAYPGISFGNYYSQWPTELPVGTQGIPWKARGPAVTFTTPPLSSDVEFLGPASADLWISSTATDTDLQVMLTEVRPDGQEQYVQRGWLRLSHRALDAVRSTPLRPFHTHLEADARPLTRGEPVAARVEIVAFDHVFRAGSSIRLTLEAPVLVSVGIGGPGFVIHPEPSINLIHHDRARSSRLVLGFVPGRRAASVMPACDTVEAQPCRPNTEPVPSGSITIDPDAPTD